MKKSANRRAISSGLQPPERVSDEVIHRCRRDIESDLKRMIRNLVRPWIKWRYSLRELGEGFHWQRGKRITIQPGSRIGRFAYLGGGFEAHGPIIIGDLCMIAAGCKIVGADHLYQEVGTPTRLAFAQKERPATIFGADVWVGQRATILEGLTIGTGAVIGSAAVVTRSVPPYTIVAGVPARVIKERFSPAERIAHETAVLGSG